MKATRIHLQWDPTGSPNKSFRTGVSLHSHTLHSRESLDFIEKAARHSGLLRAVLKRGGERFQAYHGVQMNLANGWWTPPLSPLDAFNLESRQITDLGMAPIVSLSDHDSIEAPMALQAMKEEHVPISVEWTVPFGPTFFHFGIHNLPASRERATMDRLARFTQSPTASELASIFNDLHASPETLVIFNHPLWDENGVGKDRHLAAAVELLGLHGKYVHAFEVNGLRPWIENRDAIRLAAEWNKPAISGGDRHILEPNAVLNLTNASTFGEFASEVRAGYSEILIASQYREAYASRIFHNMLDVFRTYEGHGKGWKEWSDRVFFQIHPESEPQSLTQLFGGRAPLVVRSFAGFMQFAGTGPVRSALRQAYTRTESVVL